MRAEQAKKESEDKRIPIPYYLIDAFAKYECTNRNALFIKNNLNSAQQINNLVKFYTYVTKYYTKDYNNKYNIEYNMMIKRKVEYDILETGREVLS